jgi:hypothetical protein
MARRPLIRDHRHALGLGLALTVAGAYLIWDAHEGRGRTRPFYLRAFSGWV